MRNFLTALKSTAPASHCRNTDGKVGENETGRRELINVRPVVAFTYNVFRRGTTVRVEENYVGASRGESKAGCVLAAIHSSFNK